MSSGANSCWALCRALTLKAQIFQGKLQNRGMNDRCPAATLLLLGQERGEEKSGEWEAGMEAGVPEWGRLGGNRMWLAEGGEELRTKPG